jgi:hypothetical protein
MNDLVPLNKRGVRGVGYTAGGLGIMVLSAFTGNFLLALIAGGATFVVGAAIGASKDRSDRNVGLGVMGAGILAAISGLRHIPIINIFSGLAGSLLGVAGIGLLGYGVYNIVKFVKGLKDKS